MKTGLADPCIEIVQNEGEHLGRAAGWGKGAIGYFCTYTPIELIHSMGFVPVRISGSSRSVELAYSLVPGFICPFMKGALEKGLRGEYDMLSGIVQGYTCDAACGVLNIWEENIGGKIISSLPLPYNDTPEARKFMRSRIIDLVSSIESIGGTFSEESLKVSLELYTEIRRAVLSLYTLRFARELPLTAGEFLNVILAGFLVPPEDYLDLLTNLRGELGAATAPSPGDVPVLVSGSVMETPEILDLIEECGGSIVADDLCTGYRNFQNPEGAGTDPVEALIDRHMKRCACPSRGRAVERAPLLLNLIRDAGAKGVIFLFQKFCTPHLADQPVLVRELGRNGIPALALELEESTALEGQFRTRIEGFMEMMRR